jgi:hypothetical protein
MRELYNLRNLFTTSKVSEYGRLKYFKELQDYFTPLQVHGLDWATYKLGTFDLCSWAEGLWRMNRKQNRDFAWRY